MSIRSLAWALDQKCPSPAAKLVLIKLADYSNDEGECWPSQGRMARDCGIGRTTINYHIKKLMKIGLVAALRRYKDNGGKTSNLYALAMHTHVDEIDIPMSMGSTTHVDGHDTPMSMGSTSGTFHLEPTIEPKTLAHAKAHSRRSAAAPLSDPDFEAWWKAYPRHVGKKAALVKYRVARKTVEAEPLLAAARLYAEKRLGEDAQFTAHPATWLNQGRWLDDEAQPPPERALEPLPANWRELINLPTEEEPNDHDQSTTSLSNHDRKTAA